MTLDGDVEFQPEAVRLMIDKIKENKKLGSVCGRVLPIGKGPMVWYQHFEYAVGHWLQKAAEHMFVSLHQILFGKFCEQVKFSGVLYYTVNFEGSQVRNKRL